MLGLGFLTQGFVMPLVAERSDVASLEFQQIREASSHLGIGLMIGAVACGVLDRTRGAATQASPYVPPPPTQQPYSGQQHSSWQTPPQR